MNMYISMRKKLLAKALDCWSYAFVINNVSGIAIESKESLVTFDMFKTMFLDLHTLGNVYMTGSVGNKQYKN